MTVLCGAPAPATTLARELAREETDELADSDTRAGRPDSGFTVRLDNFEGPFDLLLQLISKHELDVTEVALHKVTDEFIAHTRALGERADLDETTQFLVVAATLLDLKAARLLPSAEVEDAEDLALLEARDLLFARLMQYQAYKQVAALFAELESGALRRYPRSVALEERYTALLPEVMLGVSPQSFAEIAAAVFRPKPPPTVSIAHLHGPHVSVAEQAALLRARLLRSGGDSFRALVADCTHTMQVVARFLALLDLYRDAAIAFDQVDPLGELWVRWIGGPDATADAADAAEPADTGAEADEENQHQ